jgi:hypothetical protein
MNSYSKVAGYKIHLQNSLAFPYSNNKQTEKEYMETTHLNSLKKNQISSSKLLKGCE